MYIIHRTYLEVVYFADVHFACAACILRPVPPKPSFQLFFPSALSL